MDSPSCWDVDSLEMKKKKHSNGFYALFLKAMHGKQPTNIIIDKDWLLGKP
jgi:hypothetical protein